MSEIKNSGLDQYGKVLVLNGIGGERVVSTRPTTRLQLTVAAITVAPPERSDALVL